MSSASQFTAGQRVWCGDGRLAEFLAETPHGFVVRLGFYRPNGNYEEPDEYYDRVEMVAEVFSAPPVEAVEARIADLLAAESVARASLAASQSAIRDSEREAKERLSKLAKYPPLEMLEALLDGRVTHFAVKSSYSQLAQVETFEEATTWIDNDYKRNKKELRMLALVGTGDKMQWMVNQYGDGSGHWKAVVHPCLSYEDAVAKVSEYCLDAAASLPPNGIDSRHIGVAENAKKYGIEIPSWIPEAVSRVRAEAAQAEIDKAATALKVAQARAAAVVTP